MSMTGESAEEYIPGRKEESMKAHYRRLIKRAEWIAIAFLGLGFSIAAAAY
jgi:hypothetical protein